MLGREREEHAVNLLVTEVESFLGKSQELIALFSNLPVQLLKPFQSSTGPGTDQRLTEHSLDR